MKKFQRKDTIKLGKFSWFSVFLIWHVLNFFFPLNLPQRYRVNGKFLPHITKKWGWKRAGRGEGEKRSSTKLCFQLSTFKSLVQIQSTKIIQHLTVTDSDWHCKVCDTSYYYVRKLPGIL